MSQKIDVDAGLLLGHLPAGHRLQKVVSAALTRTSPSQPVLHRSAVPAPWTATFFGLERCRAFTALREEDQQALVHDASTSLLHEAYFIEKLGLAFGAKMLLLSATTEERMLYALFCADEARHLNAVGQHLEPNRQLTTHHPFHELLADVIEHGSKETLTFVIQVVLEGWGLTHYRALSEGCQDQGLRLVLRRILEDEALHHGSGKMLVEDRGLGAQALKEITEVLAAFLDMVRPGPLSLVAQLEQACGGMTRAQRQQVLEDIDATSHAARRLEQLRKLMSIPAASPVIEALTDRRLFEPLSPAQAADASERTLEEACG